MSDSVISRVLGDPVPAALAAYYANLDDDRPEAAAGAFSDDAVYARPVAGAAETAPRQIVEGREAIRQFFVERGHREWRHRLIVCVVEGADCLLEGITEQPSGEAGSSFTATAQFDPDGRITRYVAFTCEPVTDPAPMTGDATPGDARAVVERYFEALRTGDSGGAAACFSENVVYCHPPYTQGGLKGSGRIWFRGRRELRAAFEKRGQTSYRHQLPVLIQRGPNCLFEVRTPGPAGEDLGAGISSLSLDRDGLIQRYVAFFSTRSVHRR